MDLPAISAQTARLKSNQTARVYCCWERISADPDWLLSCPVVETTPKILGAHFVVSNSIQEERKNVFCLSFLNNTASGKAAAALLI